MAGATLLAGFIDAPLIGPAAKASKEYGGPYCSSGKASVLAAPCDTEDDYQHEKKLRMASKTKLCRYEPEALVHPRSWASGNNRCKAAAARIAPISCAMM
jgi:hypothetical protein